MRDRRPRSEALIWLESHPYHRQLAVGRIGNIRFDNRCSWGIARRNRPTPRLPVIVGHKDLHGSIAFCERHNCKAARMARICRQPRCAHSRKAVRNGDIGLHNVTIECLPFIAACAKHDARTLGLQIGRRARCHVCHTEHAVCRRRARRHSALRKFR